MQKLITLLLILICCNSCKEKVTQSTSSEAIANPSENIEEVHINYANGFTIEQRDGYKVITITNPWPGSDQVYLYALAPEGVSIEMAEQFDAVVRVPLENIVVTSTTHIPSLESLGVLDKLIGFPNLNYISSEAARKQIEKGSIRELGKNEELNTEVLIDINPSALITFAVEGENTTISKLQNTAIPVLYNGDWTETHPLGKAEWIKFFGVLLGKEKEANSLFKTIESDYNSAKEIAKKASNAPTVLSGAMFRDVWYLPQGNSWAAQLIQDANGNYLWADSEGTGSLSLSLETVLEKAQNVEYWMGPGQFTSYQEMTEANAVYTKFEAFQNQKVYSFTSKKGSTGGIIYYELAPNRPDLVLKDMIKILHPELLQEYQLQFFDPLQ